MKSERKNWLRERKQRLIGINKKIESFNAISPKKAELISIRLADIFHECEHIIDLISELESERIDDPEKFADKLVEISVTIQATRDYMNEVRPNLLVLSEQLYARTK